MNVCESPFFIEMISDCRIFRFQEAPRFDCGKKAVDIFIFSTSKCIYVKKALSTFYRLRQL